MNKTWILTDTHFGHQRLVTWGRPNGFGELILENIKKTVKPGDTVIHLGDVCMGRDEHWNTQLINALNGTRKILVMGNHDNKSASWYYRLGWDMVCRSFISRHFGKDVQFSHYPMKKSEYADMNIHGHLHGNGHRDEDKGDAEYDPGYHYDVAPDTHDYKPVELDSLVAKLSKRSILNV